MVLDLDLIFRVLLFPGFTFLVSLTMFCDWLERKIEARLQNRIGPKFTGPAGILQPLADFIKLLTKEEIELDDTRKFVYRVAPLLAFSIIIFAFCFIPLDGTNIIPGSGFQGDLIFVMALLTVSNFMLFLSGWSSSNPYSIIGATRVLVQYLGYDVPLLFVALTPAFLAGNLSISAIASSQNIPFAILTPWAFLLFIFTMQAELEKDPFDVPHAESEVVGGYETEYSGGELAFLKLTRDAQIVLGSALVVELFLGGSAGPVSFGLPALWAAIWFVLKLILVVAISEFLTVIFARLRIDQVLSINWKLLFPLSILSLALTVILASWFYPVAV